MKTLYDLLGAHPDDDAESLKHAFREAVKANHPDLQAGDPDAPLRFKQIVRANSILRDAEQRAIYDRLLDFERQQLHSKSKRAIVSDATRKIASDAIAVAVLAVALLGGYALFAHISKTSVAAVKVVEVAAQGPAEIAAVQPAAPTDTTDRDRPRDKLEGVEVPDGTIMPNAVAPAANSGGAQAVADGGPASDLLSNDASFYSGRGIATVPPAGHTDRDEPRDKLEDVGVTNGTTVPNAVAAAANGGGAQATADGGPASGLPSNDANFYRERGAVAYRSGDLHRAIADFDQAIRLDPISAGAYLNRGIVLYRLGEFDRAFADVAQAMRIENTRRPTIPPSKFKAVNAELRRHMREPIPE
jgi:tetratricopeptide (TPR) repeat protein